MVRILGKEVMGLFDKIKEIQERKRLQKELEEKQRIALEIQKLRNIDNSNSMVSGSLDIIHFRFSFINGFLSIDYTVDEDAIVNMDMLYIKNYIGYTDPMENIAKSFANINPMLSQTLQRDYKRIHSFEIEKKVKRHTYEHASCYIAGDSEFLTWAYRILEIYVKGVNSERVIHRIMFTRFNSLFL